MSALCNSIIAYEPQSYVQIYPALWHQTSCLCKDMAVWEQMCHNKSGSEYLRKACTMTHTLLQDTPEVMVLKGKWILVNPASTKKEMTEGARLAGPEAVMHMLSQ